MKAKHLALLAIVVFALFLSACSGSDGEGWMYIDAGNGGFIVIEDEASRNGFYLDKVNSIVYCGEGPDATVSLTSIAPVLEPLEGSSRLAELRVKGVCLLGQEKFDQIITLFAQR